MGTGECRPRHWVLTNAGNVTAGRYAGYTGQLASHQRQVTPAGVFRPGDIRKCRGVRIRQYTTIMIHYAGIGI